MCNLAESGLDPEVHRIARRDALEPLGGRLRETPQNPPSRTGDLVGVDVRETAYRQLPRDGGVLVVGTENLGQRRMRWRGSCASAGGVHAGGEPRPRPADLGARTELGALAVGIADLTFWRWNDIV